MNKKVHQITSISTTNPVYVYLHNLNHVKKLVPIKAARSHQDPVWFQAGGMENGLITRQK